MIALRVRRSRPGRVQISPQAYRVMRSWKSRVKSVVRADGAVDVLVAEHLAPHPHALLVAHAASTVSLNASGCSTFARWAASSVTTGPSAASKRRFSALHDGVVAAEDHGRRRLDPGQVAAEVHRRERLARAGVALGRRRDEVPAPRLGVGGSAR